MKRTDFENPNDDKGPIAAFARSKGWQVVIELNPNSYPYRIIPPIGFSMDKWHNRPWHSQTVAGAWAICAARAGYRAPDTRPPVHTRLIIPPKPRDRRG